MGKLVLITGGGRSGKSDFGLKLAETLKGPRLFIATCPITDPEMADRIQKHRTARDDGLWSTIEEQTRLAEIISHQTNGVVLVDCLTLWINNLLYAATEAGRILTEKAIEDKSRELAHACKATNAVVFLITGEVGSGIVPADKETRLYRDLIGKCNQIMASFSDEVYMVSCGLPIQLKPGNTYVIIE